MWLGMYRSGLRDLLLHEHLLLLTEKVLLKEKRLLVWIGERLHPGERAWEVRWGDTRVRVELGAAAV